MFWSHFTHILIDAVHFGEENKKKTILDLYKKPPQKKSFFLF